jgi:hypothetical protein
VPTPASDDAFAEVKAKVDLVQVVQEHVRLTKRNKDFWGLCAFRVPIARLAAAQAALGEGAFSK